LIDTSDMAEMDPVKAFEIIEGELGAFSDMLLEKPMIVVATKLDATTDRTRLEELREFCKKKDLEFYAISAAAGEGVKELVRGIADALDKIPKETFEDEETEAVISSEAEADEQEVLGLEAYEADDEDSGDDDQEAGAASGKNS
jgi:GTP-binding protein